MLNVFTLGAGVAVADLLPARLALWQVPRVTRARLEAPGPVLDPAGPRGPVPSRRRLAALLAPLTAARPLGKHVGAVVTDLDTGTVLYSQNAGSAFVPASNAKMLTAVAALSSLGPSARFTTRALAPGWTPGYISTGNVTPITSLEVDQGRLTRSGAPQDADDPGNFRPRSATPAADAAGAFAGFLRRDGIHVTGHAAPGRRPRHAAPVAAVRSPVLSAIVGWMLRESNNVIAEDLARQVALRTGRPASFGGAAAAVTAALGRLGAGHGIHLVDGSGLSPLDLLTPAALAAVVRLAALGVVRAKTGNLSKVASLSGIVDDASGQVLAFAFMADQIPKASMLPAAAGTIDAMATALAGCGCR